MFGLDLAELMSTLIILIICGCLAGFLAGLLGIGGGVVFVPVFYFVFMHAFHADGNTAMVLATGTSLTCMIPTSISAAISQHKRGNTDLNLIKTWAPGLIAGVVIGAVTSSFYGGEWLAILFGCVMILNSLNTLLRAKAKPMFAHLPGVMAQRLIGFCISCFSVMLGIGGGTLTVPVLNACSVEPHKSIGTSSAVSLFVCVPGAVIMLATGTTPADAPLGTFGLVNLLAAVCVVPISVLFAPLGVRFGKNVSPVTLKRIFAVALFIVSVRMLAGALL